MTIEVASIAGDTPAVGGIVLGLGALGFCIYQAIRKINLDVNMAGLVEEARKFREELRIRVQELEKENKELQFKLVELSSQSGGSSASVFQLQKQIDALESDIKEIETSLKMSESALKSSNRFIDAMFVVITKARSFLDGCDAEACPGGYQRKFARNSLNEVLAAISERMDKRSSDNFDKF